jgi:hypothetical protein
LWYYNYTQLCSTIEMHKLHINHVYILSSKPYINAPMVNNKAFVCTWNSIYQFGEINIGTTIYLFLITSHACWHVKIHMNGCLPHQFSFVCHYQSKIFNETHVKLCHVVKQLYLVRVYRDWHVHNCLYLFRIK